MAKADTNSLDPRNLSVSEFVNLLDPTNSEMEPRTFSRLIKHASTEQLSAVLDDPDRRRALFGAIFSRMTTQFRPDRAPSEDSALHWRITGGPDGDEVYETVITGTQSPATITGTQSPATPRCSTSREPSHDPRVTLTMSGDQFLALVSGNGSPAVMLMTGKVSLDGDVIFAANLANLFDIPHS